MKRIYVSIVALPLMLALPASADPYKDESGHGRYEHRGYGGKKHKEEYWVGNCKIERKWEGGGRYKEERKCEGPRDYHQRYEAPVVIYPSAPPPSVVIHVPVVIR